jgi:hypothetical protein
MVSLHAPIITPAPRGQPLGPPLAVLVEPSGTVAARVIEAIASRGFRVHVTADPEPLIESAALVVVEADRGARAVDMIRRLHARRPELPIAGVLAWWSDDEREIAGIARYVLHVPLRDEGLAGLRDLAASLVVPSR